MGPAEQPIVEDAATNQNFSGHEYDDHKSIEKKSHTSIEQDSVSKYQTENENSRTIEINTITPDEVEQFIVVETETFTATLSTYGAGLTSYKIKPIRTYLNDEVELIPVGSRPRPFYRFWTYEGPVDTDKLKFRFGDEVFSNGSKVKVASGKERQLSFVTTLGEGKNLEVIYTFSGDGYKFKYEISTTGLTNVWVRPDAEVYWKGGLAYTEPDSGQDVWYSKANIYYSGDVLEKMNLNDSETETEGLTTGETKWGSVRTKYFMAALIPEGGMGTGAWMESEFDSTYIGKYHPNKLGVGIRIPIQNGEPSLALNLFLGPLDDEVLDNVDASLNLAMTWGAGIKFLDSIVSPISRIVLWGLKGIHKFVPNYGLCVILFSIVIKIVIWPLTRKSYQSMAAMQRLQPKIQELRDKHGKDQQRLQREIMQLYKTEKVNPMGGCLPMLLQMPLLYALFVIFRSTIEFRRAPFVLWIQDLSLPDAIMQLPFSLPLYGSHVALLPIVMGITTYFQSKSTMTDPNQRMMLYFMPVFLTLIFNQFPSGLTLYYTLFNIWTLMQQKYTASRFPGPATQVSSPSQRK